MHTTYVKDGLLADLKALLSWFPPELENEKAFSIQGKVRKFCQDWKNKEFN